jgi:hypothetical protein
MRKWRQGHSACLVLAGALIAAPAAAAGAGAQQVRAVKSSAAKTAVVYQGVQVAIDPATGRLRAPTDAERQALSAAMLQHQEAQLRAAGIDRPLNQAEAQATLKRNARGRIGMSMQVPENQMNYLTAERRADGSIAIQHQGDEPAAKAEAVTQ